MKRKFSNSLLASLTFSMAVVSNSHAANRTWDGGGGDNNWNTAANWDAAVSATADTLIFAGTTRLNNTNNFVTTVTGLTFSNGAGAFVLGGAVGFTTINLGGNIVNSGTNTTLQTIDLNLVLTGNRQFNVNGTARLQVNGVISESGGARTLVINNAAADDGTVILTGNNSYTGATTVSNGVLNIQHANALGTTTAGTTVASGAALQIQGGITTAAEALAIDGTGITTTGALRNISGNNTYAGAITINSATRINSDADLLTLNVASGNAITGTNDNLTFGGAGNITIADAIATGTGTLTKDGTGTLTLSAANTYTGLTTVSAGTLAYGVTNALSTGAVTVNGGILNIATFSDSVGAVTLTSGSIDGTSGVLTGSSYALNGATDTSVSAILGGAAVTLTKTGAGTATLSGANTYTGLTTVTTGTLAYGANDALSSGAVTVDGGTLDIKTFSDTVGAVTLSSGSISGSTGVLTGTSYSLTNTGSVSAILAGAVTLTKSGAGTATLSGANTYSGVTDVQAGILLLGNATALGSTAAGTTVNGGTLDLNGQAIGNEAIDFSTSTAASLVNSSGTAASLSGAISGLQSDTSIGGAGDLTLSGVLSSTGNNGWIKNGAGTLTLTGNNTFTRAVTVSAGALNIQHSNALGATTGTGTNSVTSGAALEMQGGITTPAAENFTLNGTGVATGGALRNISGANTYAGALTLGSATRINSDLGTLTLNSATAISGATFGLTFGGAGDIAVSSAIGTTTGTLTKDGAGTLTLAGANTYTGLTTVSAGTLAYGVTNALNTGAVTVSGGTLDIKTFNDTVGAVTLSSGSITGTSGILTGTSYAVQSGSVSAILGGAAVAMSKTTAGTVTLSGNNTFGGGLTLTAGTVVFGHDSAAGTGTLTLTSGTIEGTGGARTITNNLAIGGNLTFSGAQDLEFTDSFDQVANRIYTVNNTTTFSGAITGGDNLTKSGTGILQLSGSNTIATVTVNSGGALRVASNGALGTPGAGTDSVVSSGGALELIGGRTIGDETLTLDGTGVSNDGALRNISGNNSFAGAITINSTTRINSDSGLLTLDVASGNAITGSNDSLQFGGAGDITLADAISSGTGTLTKDGNGKLTFSAGNTYSGATSVSAGTLFANNASGSATGTSAVTVASGAIFGGSGTSTPTGTNGINVTGALAPGGSVGATGNFTINLGSTSGTVVMNNAATFQYDLGVAGVDINSVGTSDLLTLAGAAASDFAFNGNSIDFLGTGGIGYYKLFDTSSNATNTWTGLTVGGTGLITGGLTASNLTSGLTGSLIMGGSALGGTTGDIYLHVVPEPSAALLAGIGSLFLLRRRRVA